MTQMMLAQHEHMIKAFASDRADQSFGITVLPRRSRRYRSVANAHRSNAPSECPAVDPIARPHCRQTVLYFEAVASPEEIPNDSQLLENSVLIRFERDEMMKVDSPFFVAGAEKS
jgi:hypothetical protein